jgi:hypothetical protein
VRVAAVAKAGGLALPAHEGAHAELFRRLLWRGWRADYVARPLVGRSLPLGSASAARARAVASVMQIEELESQILSFRRERDAARAERDRTADELRWLSGTRWVRLGNRLDPLRARLRDRGRN